MAVELAGQDISDVRIIGSPREVGGVRLVGSTLKRCVAVQHDDPGFGLVIRDVVVERCRMDACHASGVLFEDVVVDTLRLARMHQLVGCVFKHVTLRGRIGPIMAIPPSPGLPNESDLIAGAVEKYKEVDWALDIREAVFSSADLFFVPGHLVLRDQDTQVLVRRESFSDVDRQELPIGVRIWLRRLESTPFDSIVAIAPKASKNFRDYMADIEWLHEKGLAG